MPDCTKILGHSECVVFSAFFHPQIRLVIHVHSFTENSSMYTSILNDFTILVPYQPWYYHKYYQ